MGYKDPVIAANRQALFDQAKNMNRKVTYTEAVQLETGAIQTDDFKFGTLEKDKTEYQSKFSVSAFIKIWGCNSGVTSWVYSDTDQNGNNIVDPNNSSADYYWRAFNEVNIPKLSIAQTMATFFNRKVFGANSGANIMVNFNNTWISSQQYKKNVGHWP